jgi:hypothetical protein
LAHEHPRNKKAGVEDWSIATPKPFTPPLHYSITAVRIL